MKSITDSGDFPALSGAYGLLLKLDVPRSGFSPGSYLYCGSAKGPGGLRARLGRHLRDDKRPHWHIDRLADQHSVFAVIGYFALAECEILRRASQALPSDFPVKGFGSSDCRSCPSHLLRLDGEIDTTIIEAAMRPDFMWTVRQCALPDASSRPV